MSLCEFVRVCASLREFARVCASLREFARVCASLRKFAQVGLGLGLGIGHEVLHHASTLYSNNFLFKILDIQITL